MKKEFSVCRFDEAQLKELGNLSSFYSCRGLVDVISVALRRKYSEDKKSTHFMSAIDSKGNEVFHSAPPKMESKRRVFKYIMPCVNEESAMPGGFAADYSSLPQDSLRCENLPFELLKEVMKQNARAQDLIEGPVFQKFDDDWRQW